MNLSTSQTRSSSCQCTTTLNGEQKETRKDVNTIHRQLQIMLAVIGLSWGLDQKRRGTELTLTNPADHGINHLQSNSGKRRTSEDKISISRESKLLQSIPVPSSNSRPFKRPMLLILHCQTMYCYRKDLSSTSTTSGTRMN